MRNKYISMMRKRATDIGFSVISFVFISCSLLVALNEAGIILNDAERTICLRKVVEGLKQIPIPNEVVVVAEKAHQFGLNGYFLVDIGGPATDFIIETAKIAFTDIIDDEQYLESCDEFTKKTGKYVYGYRCAARSIFQDMMNQHILGQRNIMNDFTRLSNACLFLVLAHKDAKLSEAK